MQLQLILRVAGIVGWAAIAIMSVVPAAARPHSGAGGFSEHFVAYTCVAACLWLGLSGKTRNIAVILLCGGAAFFEFVQLFIPGRTSELAGFVSGCLGVLCGIAVGNLFMRLSR
jgi:hypothetical protein